MRRASRWWVVTACWWVACGAEPGAEDTPTAATAPVVAPSAPSAREGEGVPAAEASPPAGSAPATVAASAGEVAPAVPGATPVAAPPASSCARAQACCPAYVAALPNGGERAVGEQACASLVRVVEAGGRAADEACEGALEGFRQSLEASGREVPAACR